jgi:hypothetical protein
MLQTFFSTLPQICALTQSCLKALRTIPSSSWLGFVLTFTVNCGTLYRQVCAFPNHVQSIGFATCGLQSSCRNILRMINGNTMHLSSISSLIAKGLNTYVNKVFLFFIFNTFAKIYTKKCFALSLWGIVCRLIELNIFLVNFRITL